MLILDFFSYEKGKNTGRYLLFFSIFMTTILVAVNNSALLQVLINHYWFEMEQGET